MTRADRHYEISFTPPMECLAINNPPDGPGWTHEALCGAGGYVAKTDKGDYIH